jgi:hypothetical protein
LAAKLKIHLEDCGYRGPLLCRGYRLGTQSADIEIPLAGFAHEPLDARSACVAVITDVKHDPIKSVAAISDLGAPVVLVVKDTAVQWWRQASDQPQLRFTVPQIELPRFFGEHARELAPERIYRAKTLGRLTLEHQLGFVDVGLMPLVDRRLGLKLAQIVADLVAQLRSSSRHEPGQWLFKIAFGLLAAKILKDKRVPSFARLDFGLPGDVLGRVARHYGSNEPVEVGGRSEREALEQAARTVGRLGSLENVTTEALAHVYESTLVDRQVRKELGIHSTPSYLVDYVVWRLDPWIRDIQQAQRHVFEPASGHAGFLVAAMRLLRELLPRGGSPESRCRYLRQRLHGVEVDPFAIEVARLSLTLADVPHPDGWDLTRGDMFADGVLGERAAGSMIILSNPPFENFDAAERRRYTLDGRVPQLNKSTEMLARILPNLRPGAVCGLVLPQGVLYDKDATQVRRALATDFELMEICQFPDKVFDFSDAESAVILARRRPARTTVAVPVLCRRVRERDIERFQQTYEATVERRVSQVRFGQTAAGDMRLRELEEIWAWCARYPRLDSVARAGQGLQHKAPEDLPAGVQMVSKKRFAGAVAGYVGLEPDVLIHERPRRHWLNVDAAVIRRAGTGTQVQTPQVLLNYAPVSRGPWRLKALIDPEGHAVTSRFLTVRPRHGWPLEFFWALLNSPVANAFAFDRLAKRDILAGVMRQLPVPRVSDWGLQRVSEAARAYLDAAAGTRLPLFEDRVRPDVLPGLLLQLDAEVLALYDLPPRLERRLLDVFAGQRRVGVPFDQLAYYPQSFTPWISLGVYLSDAYQRSTAAQLLARNQEPAPRALVAALRRAVEAYPSD